MLSGFAFEIKDSLQYQVEINPGSNVKQFWEIAILNNCARLSLLYILSAAGEPYLPHNYVYLLRILIFRWNETSKGHNRL